LSVRIEEVARRAGVSIATVSRVLADKPHVSPGVRQRVLAAVTALDYRPNRVARTLRAQQSKIIGLIISDIQNPFFTAIVRAVEDIARQYEFLVVLCNSDEDPDKEAGYVDWMLADNIAGIILSPTGEESVVHVRLKDARIPVVAIDRRLPAMSVDTVLCENQQTTQRLITHLIEHGHTRIGAVIGSPNVSTGAERRAGYLCALLEHQLPVLPELLYTGIPKEDSGYKLTKQLLALPAPPTALFAGNNLLTMGALRAIHETGWVIPDDVALVAFDEMDWMFVMKPPLTVVAQPTYEMGRQAIELLLKRIADFDRPVTEILLQPTIYFRGSSVRSI
jgi:DNA-binding LacI/PurR family transcriptional regulator